MADLGVNTKPISALPQPVPFTEEQLRKVRAFKTAKPDVVPDGLKDKLRPVPMPVDKQKPIRSGILDVTERAYDIGEKPRPEDVPTFETWPSTGPTSAPGMLKPGNIDLTKRPSVHFQDGSSGSILTVNFPINNNNPKSLWMVAPSITPDGHILTEDQAKAYALKTGKNLGIFDNEYDSTRYAVYLHLKQGGFQTFRNGGSYKPNGEYWVNKTPEQILKDKDAYSVSNISPQTAAERKRETHRMSSPSDFPLQTEGTEHVRISSPPVAPNLSTPNFPKIGVQTVKRPENRFDRNIPFGTGVAQFVAGQAVGVSELAQKLDKKIQDLESGEDTAIGVPSKFITHQPILSELPSVQRFDEKANRAVEGVAKEGPVNRTEAAGQIFSGIAELDLTADKVGEFIQMAYEFLKHKDQIAKLNEYLKKTKTAVHAANISKRTASSAAIAGLQTLIKTGGNVDAANEEAGNVIKSGLVLEGTGLGIAKAIEKSAPNLVAGASGLEKVAPDLAVEAGDIESKSGDGERTDIDNALAKSAGISSSAARADIEKAVAKEAELQSKSELATQRADEGATISLNTDPVEDAAKSEIDPQVAMRRIVKKVKQAKHIGTQVTQKKEKKNDKYYPTIDARDRIILNYLRSMSAENREQEIKSATAALRGTAVAIR